MDKPAQRICLITPGHLSSAPRIVKEAEALQDAGYDVHLVSSSHYAPVEPLDQPILRRATWKNIRVRTAAGPQAFLRRLRRRWLRRFRPPVARLSLRQALLLHCPGLSRLMAAAADTRADFFHGHCVAGLAAAAQAAALRGVPYGFDAEDFHEAETVEVERDPFEGAIVRHIMGACLCGAKLLTAASPLIAAEYRKTRGVEMEVLLNVFPLRHALAEPPPARRISPATPARLYWFSQTVGPGRGLERMFEVMARMQTPVELHLRGFASDDNAAWLGGRAAQAGVARSLVFHPPASPDEMVRLAADAELGLSLEESRPRNRDLCLTNKIFVYLLAGIPQLLSQTTAQAAFAPELGSAAILGALERPAELAVRLDDFLSDADRIRAARQHAWHLARTRLCWEVEKNKLLVAVRRALSLA